jgi:hypothetical protein
MIKGAVVRGLETENPAQSQYRPFPYFTVFSSEAVLPADIAFQSLRVKNHDEERSNEARELEVNCIEE